MGKSPVDGKDNTYIRLINLLYDALISRPHLFFRLSIFVMMAHLTLKFA